MTEIYPQNSSNDSPTKEKSVNCDENEKKEEMIIDLPFQKNKNFSSKIKYQNISKQKSSAKNENLKGKKIKENNDSFEISVDSMILDEEELLQELIKENNKTIHEKNNSGKLTEKTEKINPQNKINSYEKEKESNETLKNKIYDFLFEKNKLFNNEYDEYIKENKLLNLKRKLLELKNNPNVSNNSNNSNKKNNTDLKPDNNLNHPISEEEKTLIELINKYTFNIVFKACLENKMDENKPLDQSIIKLKEKIGYKEIFKILLTKYSVLKTESLNESSYLNIKEEETKSNSLIKSEDIIIKNIDIKSNKYRQIQKNNITRNNKGLGLHLHKYKNGEIYKYLLHRMDNAKGWFYCSDRNCKGVGILSLKNKKFQITRDHTLKYQEHNFYTRILPNEIGLFKDFRHYDKNDVQIIYKYDGGAFAVFY